MKVFTEQQFFLALDSYIFFRREFNKADEFIGPELMDESDEDRVAEQLPEIYAAWRLLLARKRKERALVMEMLNRIYS